MWLDCRTKTHFVCGMSTSCHSSLAEILIKYSSCLPLRLSAQCFQEVKYVKMLFVEKEAHTDEQTASVTCRDSMQSIWCSVLLLRHDSSRLLHGIIFRNCWLWESIVLQMNMFFSSPPHLNKCSFKPCLCFVLAPIGRLLFRKQLGPHQFSLSCWLLLVKTWNPSQCVFESWVYRLFMQNHPR